MPTETAPSGFDPEQFKAEITKQARTIMREIMAAERRQGGQEPPVPQARPLDLDIEDPGRQQLEDDQETLLAEPVI